MRATSHGGLTLNPPVRWPLSERTATSRVPRNWEGGTLEEQIRGNGMATDRLNDLKAFRDFADFQLTHDGGDLTLDEALDLWESENQSPEGRAATVRAVQEALDDMRAGETGIPAAEAFSELRRKHNLPELS